MKDTKIYPDEFVSDKYYFTTESHRDHDNCIVKYSNDESIYFINIEEKFFGKNYNKSYTQYARPATPDEIQWLNTCIRDGKFIERNFIKQYSRKNKLLLI